MPAAATVDAVARHTFAASPAAVFAAWLTPQRITQWFGPGLGPLTQVQIDARVGGLFSIVQQRGDVPAAHAGEYLHIDRPRRLVFTWRVPPDTQEPSTVSVDITPLASGGCTATVTHTMAAQWAPFADRASESWLRMLQAMDGASD